MTFDTRKIYDITSNDSLQERAVLRAKYFEKKAIVNYQIYYPTTHM